MAALARESQERAPAVASAPDPRRAGSRHAGPEPAGPEPAVPLAESIDVTCRFGSFTAVKDVSIQVRSGEIVGLLGANGAGKTTLIRMLLGLIPASAGQVLLLGESPGRETRRRIGYVPQGLGLYEDLTPAENMEFATAVFGVRAGSEVRLSESLARPGRSRIPVGRLPLGIQRRAAFAQALAHEPDLLILDEPTSGVDPLGRARLWQAIADAVQAGAGALVSTHYMEEAGECDRLIIMADGSVVAAGTVAEIIGQAEVTVVEAADWAAAFARLEQAGLPVSLAGRVLRVPGASPDEVRRVLPDGCHVGTEPATLEERFFDLVLASGRRGVPA